MKYLIELVAEQTGFEPTVKALQDLGKADKANADQFKKTNEEAKKYTSTLDGVAKGVKEVTKASVGGLGAKAIQESEKATQSFRTQLRISREEITKMFVAGEASASQIYNMARGGGALKDAIGDASQAIQVLSSDTFKLDATMQGLEVGTSIFQGLAGASALFGDENKDLQKTLVKLNALMAITQSLQQIQNALQAQSAFRLGASIAMQKIYNVVVGESVGVTKALRIALATVTGGFIIAGLIAIIANWEKIRDAITGSSKALNDYKKFQNDVSESTGKEIANLLLLKKSLQDENISRKQKTELIKQAKKDYPEYLGQLTDEQFYTKALNDAIAKQTQLILARATAKVIEKEIEDEIIKKRKLETNGISFGSAVLSFLKSGYVGIVKEGAQQISESDKRIKELTDSYVKAIEDINKLGQTANPFDSDKKQAKDKEDLAKKALDQRKKDLEDEIAILETNKIELARNRQEVLKIDENLIIARAKLAKLGEESQAKIGLIDSQTIQAISELHKKYYDEEKARIDKNTESFKVSEKIKRDEISETNRLKQEALEKERENNAKNLELLQESLAEENRLRQEQFEFKEKEEEQRNKEIINQAFSIAQKISDGIFAIKSQERQQELDATLNALYKKRDVELANKNLTENQKKRITDKYQKEELLLKKRAFEQDQDMKAIQAGINAALAVTMAFAQLGPIGGAIASAGILTAMAIEIAAIKKAKFPAYAKGTEFVDGKGTGTSDDVPAYLSKGERVVPADINAKLKGIPNKMLPALVQFSAPKVNQSVLASIEKNVSLGIDYSQMAKAIGKELSQHEKSVINIDKNGFNVYLQNGNNISRQLNNSISA